MRKLPKLTPATSPEAPTRPTDADMLARIRALPEAKPFRAAMLYYTGVRNGQGPEAAADAELNAYRKALELVVAMLGAKIA